MSAPGAVGGEAEGIHVGRAASKFGITLCIGEGHAETCGARRWHRIHTDLNRIEVVFKTVATREAAAVIASPDAVRAVGSTKVAHALANVIA